MNVKYSILIFPQTSFFPRENYQFDFDGTTRFTCEKGSDTLAALEGDHWKGWVGSLDWGDIEKSRFQVQAWRRTDKEVLDNENNELLGIVQSYQHGLMLLGPLLPPIGKFFSITGDGVIDGGRLVPKHIRAFTHHEMTWKKSGYMDDLEYMSRPRWTRVRDAENHCYQTEFFEEWKVCRDLLWTARSDWDKYMLLNLSIMAFIAALSDRIYDFKFPNLVRAIETILALKAEQGQRVFARRVKKLLPAPTDLHFEYSEQDIKKMLKTSYQIRSDSVHGKPFGWSLGRKRLDILNRGDGKHYEYVLETAARIVLRFALSEPEVLESAGHRNKLEDLWVRLDPEPQDKIDRFLGQAIEKIKNYRLKRRPD